MFRNTLTFLLCVIFLIALPFSTSHKNHHTCIHDEISKGFQPRMESHTEGRILLNGIEDQIKPLRVKFETSALEQLSNKELVDFIKHDILPLAGQFLQTRLNIKRRTIPIKIDFDKCYLANVPESIRNEGINDADLVIFVTAEASQASFAAWATSCLKDSVNGRPIAGQINFNLNYIDTDPASFESYLGTTLHEICHILGFSYWGFISFVDPNTGKVRPQGELVEKTTARGFNTTILKTKKVVQVAKEHYGCDSVRGVEMENQGGGGSLGSHFERTILKNEIMTASVIKNQAFSKLTMAVLEDSGWYYPNYELADDFFFGKNSGCDMFEKGCHTNPLPKDYCRPNEDQSDICSLNYGSKAWCSEDGWADGCSYIEDGGQGRDCSMKTKDPEENYQYGGERFGPSSKCVLGSLTDIRYRPDDKERARCMEFKCNSGRVTLYAFNGKSVTCNQDGERVSIDGYSGYLICPPASIYCSDSGRVEGYAPCPNYCSAKGKCIRGKCECKLGRSGSDCSQISGCASDCNGNGVCQPNGTCRCNEGWRGNACENQIDPCASINCGSNGVCDSGRCVCNSGYTGTNCNEVVDPCSQINCGSNGACRSGKCVCESGWTGSDCNTRVDPCNNIRCTNGVCASGVCRCYQGWAGKDCSQKKNDPCLNVKCLNGGRCNSGACVCAAGFSGSRCETKAFIPKNCVNNCSGRGTCESGKCACVYPAGGDDCSYTYEQGCPDNTCSGNGFCYQKKCYCHGNHRGDNCEESY